MDESGDGGGGENLNTNYNTLLKQIQTLSDLQNSGAIQNADPNLQVNVSSTYYFLHHNINIYILAGCVCCKTSAAGSANKAIVETIEHK